MDVYGQYILFYRYIFFFDDPDRVRPPQRGNDERSIGQRKKVV